MELGFQSSPLEESATKALLEEEKQNDKIQ